MFIIFLTKITAAQNEVALSSDRVRGLYFLVVIFAATIVKLSQLFHIQEGETLHDLCGTLSYIAPEVLKAEMGLNIEGRDI